MHDEMKWKNKMALDNIDCNNNNKGLILLFFFLDTQSALH